MVSVTRITGHASQAAAKATLTVATIVMAGSLPLAAVEEQPHDPIRITLTPYPFPEVRGEPAASEPACRQAFPPLTTQAVNLFQAAVVFVGDDCALVDEAEYRRRLDVCPTCDRRAGKRCTACGCWIGVKARGRAELERPRSISHSEPLDWHHFVLNCATELRGYRLT